MKTNNLMQTYFKMMKEEDDLLFEKTHGAMEILKKEFSDFCGCPYCGSLNKQQHSSQFCIGKRLPYFECRECGLVYPYPRLTMEKLHERINSPSKNFFYSRIYRRGILTNHEPISQNRSLSMKAAEIFDYEVNLLKSFKKNGQILEVGCADGYFLKKLEKAGFMVKGIEPNEILYSYACKSMMLDVACGTFEAQRLKPEFFDIVIFRDTFYHLFDPRRALEKTHQILKDGGIILIKTFNIGSFSIQNFPEASQGINPLDVPINGSLATYKRMIEAWGFKVMRICFLKENLTNYLRRKDILQASDEMIPLKLIYAALDYCFWLYLRALKKTRNIIIIAKKI